MAASEVKHYESKEVLKLYNYWRSSASWRVRIALAYKGLPYENTAVNLLKGEQKTEEFTKLNPLQLVPVLVDGDLIVSDSLAIIEYLEEKYPEPPLYPSDIKKRALVRQVVNCIVASIHPLQNVGVLLLVEEKLGPAEKTQWARHFIEKGFTALEKLLKETAGKYSFGDDFSLADLVLVPQIANSSRHNIDMTKFPLLKRIGEAARALPWVEEASPEKQPDAIAQ